jgi:hypothetical protein
VSETSQFGAFLDVAAAQTLNVSRESAPIEKQNRLFAARQSVAHFVL